MRWLLERSARCEPLFRLPPDHDSNTSELQEGSDLNRPAVELPFMDWDEQS
jgi:hypothetical protein